MIIGSDGKPFIEIDLQSFPQQLIFGEGIGDDVRVQPSSSARP